MIRGLEFIEQTKKYNSFLVDEFDFIEFNITNREGLFYDVEYKKDGLLISISYENREDYLQVILFRLINGKKPEYDDKHMTIHLEKLNNALFKTLSSNNFKENEICFASLNASSNIERKLLKAAKELRLCLKHPDVSAFIG